MTKMIRATISMPRRLHRLAKITAEASGNTLSGVVQRLLTLYLHQPDIIDGEAPQVREDAVINRLRKLLDD